MDAGEIGAETLVEDVVAEFPESVSYLDQAHGLHVICCGAPVWATLGEIAHTRGLVAREVVDGLRAYLGRRDAPGSG